MFSQFSQRDLLLCAYKYFDISEQRWNHFWEYKRDIDPFQDHKIFTKRNAAMPRCWKEALEKKSSENALCILDKNFPSSLRKLSYVPAVLYIEGATIPAAQSLISIVGTRKPSSFGYQNAQYFSSSITSLGYGIVSGLARGIDTLAHESCLEQAGYTLAVLGSGLDNIYPKENETLKEKIIQNGGTVLSQFPNGTVPYQSNFPRRNALIATLSAGTIVIEGGEASGAIITGKLAMEHGLSCVTLLQDYRNFGGKGAIQLLENSAVPVRSVEDALQAIAFPWNGLLTPIASREKRILAKVNSNFYLDDYARENKLTPIETVIEIERLLLEGKIERVIGKYCYRRRF